MSELKPCPFCNIPPASKTSKIDGKEYYSCLVADCPNGSWFTADEWNARPIEDALEAENAKLRDVIGDYRNDVSRVLDEKCPSDERHCGCVPILRDQLNKYQKALILITTMPELSQATTIAREALQERGKFIWSEQSVGEYWVTKLDILQDRYDALEKDYADVCQKRLEAADVFSRQIIELESENAELEAERRWIPVSERLPEENQQILSTDGKEFYLDYYARWEGKDNPPCFCDGLSWAVTHWMPIPSLPEVKE